VDLKESFKWKSLHKWVFKISWKY